MNTVRPTTQEFDFRRTINIQTNHGSRGKKNCQ